MSSENHDDDDRTVIRPRAASAAAPAAAEPAAAAPVAPPADPASTPAPAPPRAAPADTGGALPVGTFLGEFELTNVVGEGGFGIVYLAWDHSLERRVALKEYMPSALAARSGPTQVQVKSERHRDTFEAGRKSFVNEAKLLAQFDHPSLVKVYRFWEANGTAYMVMPFYEGTTLKDRLRELGAAPDEAWLMGLLAPLTEALAVIHAENCYHRDIAPDNVILLQGTGRPLLLDFGAARRVIGDMTQALTVILKPGYAPVEQYAETPGMKQGPWTDIYALAASVHFAILGRTPPPSVGRLIKDDYVPLVQACAGRYSERFLHAIDLALRVRPEERTQTIEALRADLGLATAVVPDHSTQLRVATAPAAAEPAAPRGTAAPSSVPAPAAAKGRGGLVWLAGGAAVVVAAGAAYMALKPPPPTPAPAAAPASPPPVAAAPVPAPAAAPAPAPAPTPAPPPLPTALEPAAEFERVLAAQTAGFTVEASPAKAQLRVDRDNLSFSVKSARDGFVTVLVHGPEGDLIRLMPNRASPTLRIKAGQALTLPPPGVTIGTSEPVGAEHFLVLVSREPRDYAALGGTQDSGYLILPTGSAAGERLARWDWSRPPLLGTAAGCDGAGCDEFGAARFTVQVVK